MDKIKPLQPKEVKRSLRLIFGVGFSTLLQVVFLLILVIVALNILVYYVFSIKQYGFMGQETVKFAIYLAIGSYFFFLFFKKELDKILGIKRDLPPITPEEIAK